jgi:tRNA (guanine37-N1)-methyltransferase
MVGLGPFTIDLDYSYWTYAEIIEAILPEEDVADGEFPEGFTLTGHVCELHDALRSRLGTYFLGSTFEPTRTVAPL